MKSIITLLFLTLISISVYGQKENKTKYYLNSKEFNLEKTYLNPNSISTLRVEKESENGEVYIFTKEKEISLITLSNLVKEYTQLKKIDQSTLFKIDGKYIYDIDGIEIDQSYFIYVDVIELSNAEYLKNKYKKLKLVEIDLESEKREPQISIRGNKETHRYN